MNVKSNLFADIWLVLVGRTAVETQHRKKALEIDVNIFFSSRASSVNSTSKVNIET